MSRLSVQPPPGELDQRALHERLISIAKQIESGDSVTLTPNAATTTVTRAGCPHGAKVFLFPQTANAAAALSTTYVATSSKDSFVINHANNAQVDRTFSYCWVR